MPDRSYALVDRTERALDAVPPGSHRVLAYGANRSPRGLAAKLGAAAASGVAVVAGVLEDFDAVYSAHVAPYGSIPAALQHSPGTALDVHLLHLDAAQRALIDVAEPNYTLCRLRGISLHLDGGERIESVDAYLTRHGCLAVDGAERALAGLRARGRAFAGLSELDALALARDRVAPGWELQAFVLAGLRDPSLQRSWTQILRDDARAFAWAGHD